MLLDSARSSRSTRFPVGKASMAGLYLGSNFTTLTFPDAPDVAWPVIRTTPLPSPTVLFGDRRVGGWGVGWAAVVPTALVSITPRNSPNSRTISVLAEVMALPPVSPRRSRRPGRWTRPENPRPAVRVTVDQSGIKWLHE